jgi:methionyl-tRNA synthetase
VAAAEAAYRSFDLAEAVKQALEISRLGNGIFQDSAPWTSIKQDEEKARDLVTLCLNLARAATVLMAPAVPSFAEKVYPILGLTTEPRSFTEATAFDLVEREMGKPDRIVDRITRAQLDQVIEASKQPETARQEPPKKAAPKPEPGPPEITIDDFTKIDLRVAQVLQAELVEGADKLLKLTLDAGDDKPRTVFAGIRTAYTPDQLKGRKVVLVYNLQPRKMRFGLSEGMVLAAGPGGKELWLLSPGDDAPPGSRIK